MQATTVRVRPIAYAHTGERHTTRRSQAKREKLCDDVREPARILMMCCRRWKRSHAVVVQIDRNICDRTRVGTALSAVEATLVFASETFHGQLK
jgi:hypothetical protein